MAVQYPLSAQLLAGLKDSGREIVEIPPGKQPRVLLSGTCSYHSYLTPGRFRLRKIWLGKQIDANRQLLGPAPLVNYIADPDSHAIALAQAMEVAQRDGRPCFNAPNHIALTRRDQIAGCLQGIAGLRVPVTVRIEPGHPDDFPQAAAEHGLRFPIIVRLAGDHGGVSTIRIDSADDWENIHDIAWGGRAVYLTEFADYLDADGLYRKHRIVMIDGTPVLRHVVIGKEWLLHRSKRLATPEADREEGERLQNFERDLLPLIKDTLGEIHRRLKLDFFGIDCHVAQDGTMTLFEANATMNILYNQPSPNRWDEPCARIRMRLEAALEKHIRSLMR